jgi:2'-5' RNA ligase
VRRIFISFDISKSIIQSILPQFWFWRDELLADFPVKMIDPTLWHVTLVFLGDQNDAVIELVEGILAEEKLDNEILVSIKGLDFFGDLTNPRLLCIKVEAGGLEEYVEKIRLKLKDKSISFDEKKFRPHLTIGRFRGNLNKEQMRILSGIKQEFASQIWGEILLKNIRLYESELNSNGSIYHLIREFKIG